MSQELEPPVPRTNPRSFPRLDLSCGARLGALGTLLVAFLAGCGSGADPSSSASSGGSGAGGSGGSGASGSGGAVGDTSGGGAGGQSPTSFATALTVQLQTKSGNYLVADQGGGAALSAKSTSAKAWETFTLSDMNGGSLDSGDTVTLKGASGQWVSAENGGGGALTVTAPWEHAWEQFRILKASGTGTIAAGDTIALQTIVGGQYVSAENAGGGAVTATAPWVKEWEELTLHVGAPVDPGVGTAKQQVLDDFAAVTAEKKTIAGQHNKYNDTPAVSSDWIESHTGKRAGLWSADFGFGQGALDNRGKMIAEAKSQWSQGAIVQIMYHNCIPTQDELCGWDDIGGANPQHLSDSQWSELVTDGTPLNNAWKARLDGLSPYFADLKAAGVAPLFRPLHEMNQGVFWWGGRGGENGTRKLFQITHDYLTNTKGFDNIVWVWDIQDFGTLGSDVNSYNPGPAYYDIAALDVYDGGYEGWKYDAMVGVAGDKPIAIGECQKVPTSDELAAQPKWSFFMLWPDFLDDNAGALPALYGASNVITLDQMPGWK
jgi:hypothetical protein